MLRPQFAAALEATQSTLIVRLVTRLSEVLASDKVAIDDRHSPRLYSRFLTGLLAKQTQNGTVLGKTLSAGPKGGAGAAGGAGASGSANFRPAQGNGSTRGARNGSAAGAASNKSASATDAGVMHDSPHTSPIMLEPEADESRDEMPTLPPTRIRSPPIVIRPPTIDSSMQNLPRTGELIMPQDARHQIVGHDQNTALMGDYVNVGPNGDTQSSAASTAHVGATVTDGSGGDMDYEDSHDMLAAMYALQDPSWLDNCLLPGFNANFADDASNSSGDMRQWYINQGAILPGASTGQGTMGAMGMGHGMQGMNHVPDLFAPGLDYTQGMAMNGADMGIDNMMDGFGYR
jgi:hypothetical protein